MKIKTLAIIIGALGLSTLLTYQEEARSMKSSKGKKDDKVLVEVVPWIGGTDMNEETELKEMLWRFIHEEGLGNDENLLRHFGIHHTINHKSEKCELIVHPNSDQTHTVRLMCKEEDLKSVLTHVVDAAKKAIGKQLESAAEVWTIGCAGKGRLRIGLKNQEGLDLYKRLRDKGTFCTISGVDREGGLHWKPCEVTIDAVVLQGDAKGLNSIYLETTPIAVNAESLTIRTEKKLELGKGTTGKHAFGKAVGVRRPNWPHPNPKPGTAKPAPPTSDQLKAIRKEILTLRLGELKAINRAMDRLRIEYNKINGAAQMPQVLLSEQGTDTEPLSSFTPQFSSELWSTVKTAQDALSLERILANLKWQKLRNQHPGKDCRDANWNEDAHTYASQKTIGQVLTYRYVTVDGRKLWRLATGHQHGRYGNMCPLLATGPLNKQDITNIARSFKLQSHPGTVGELWAAINEGDAQIDEMDGTWWTQLSTGLNARINIWQEIDEQVPDDEDNGLMGVIVCMESYGQEGGKEINLYLRPGHYTRLVFDCEEDEITGYTSFQTGFEPIF
ncbi:MAG: hypothetical protein LBF54_00445 [Holosporaceae bacterium]|jgi:hypothetical protein|nr:hypothetical protein [Holosporaceae bacterium]